jgi:hypothetical protein
VTLATSSCCPEEFRMKRSLVTAGMSALLLGSALAAPAQAMHGDDYGPFTTLSACSEYQRQLVRVGGYTIREGCHAHQVSTRPIGSGAGGPYVTRWFGDYA